MASSRSTSPASRGGSPEPLTPRSKIKALLATVQSSDDEDGGQPAKTKIPKRISPASRSLGRSPQLQDVDDGDESEVEIRPRGRLASRMQGAAPVTKVPSVPATEKDEVQGRVSPSTESHNEPTRDGDAADVEDEDEDLPVAPRRLKRQAPREATPDNSEPTARPESPSLFVSSPAQPSPARSTGHNSESDQDLPTLKSDRFKALVERKRQERLAREAAEETRKEERRAQVEKLASEMDQLDSDGGNGSSITDDEGGRRLTQEARPTRKASRKAIEEMSRETQRMARNMQLAHEAKTRKRVTTASLFERFNYKSAADPQPEPKTNSSSRPTTPQTDAEMKDAETPPSSPPVAKKQGRQALEHDDDVVMGANEDVAMPAMDESTGSPTQKLDKGKGKAVVVEPQEVDKPASKPRRQVRVKLPSTTTNLVTVDSDDELEITRTAKDKLNAVFNNVPTKKAQVSHSVRALRALAQVRSPGKENRGKSEHLGLTVGELQAQLHQRARQQAKLERDRRMDMLKAQGVVVQTAEERERQMQEVEDIVAKARREAQDIMEQERAAAKKQKGENGETENDPLAWDDSDDEEYRDSANEADGEASELEFSGSEDDGDDKKGQEQDADSNPLFDDAADEAESEESGAEAEASHEVDAEEDADELPTRQRRKRKHAAIVSDDEDEGTVEATPNPKAKMQATPNGPKTDSPAAPSSVLRSAKKTFIPGLPVEGPAGLGLTQIFAGTMDDSQANAAIVPTQSMMPDFDHFPDSNFSATAEEPAEDMVVDTQREETQATTQGVQLNFSQSQMRGLDSLLRETPTQASEIEPSQDGGLQEYTPLKDRFVEPPISTVETVLVEKPSEAPQESPLVRRGRLRRRTETDAEGPAPTPAEKKETAFSVMKDGAEKEKKRKVVDEFNHKKSKAKDMVHEQAEESEDEYAGLGGADGEDSDNDSLASVEGMIDDAAGNDVDEGKLAALFADRERASDEKEVEKLFKDITTGMLRRKRGADYDLSDSDDDGEARRRMKRRQFAKMQKALYSDERVKKMAENPGNQAFLRTIEDRGSDDEVDFLDVQEPAPAESQSQSQPQPQDEKDAPQSVPDSQPRKPLGAAGENRPPAHQRRTKDGKKPSNIGEVRETLSNLLDEPQGSVIPATEAGSDSDGEGSSPPRSDKENHAPNPRRGGAAVVDRISLKRNASSNASTASGRLAFATASTSSSFKVPALLRRATTNSLVSGTSSTSSGAGAQQQQQQQQSAGGFGEEAKIKKAAGKRSGVNAFARDNERRARVQEGERRREERKVRGAERRMGVVGGLLGRGTFE